MKAIANIQTLDLLDTLVSLTTAFILGALVGLERQYRQRTAGLRTNVLVALGAAIFVDMAMRIAGSDGAARVASYVVSGVGFLGAGVIMREEGNVRGLNTAATLWGSAAIGACAGADLIAEAVLATIFVLAANTLLRPVVNTFNRQPVDVLSSEVTSIIHVITGTAHRSAALTALESELEEANYPLADLEVVPFGDEEIEIKATLMATSIHGSDLDRITDKLGRNPAIAQVFWAPSTSD
ncbi:MgtC/SapB family protein [Pigmentiphaga sp.]|uniref:MgtC/SapB family protein n=1 Tax=Pigmentiphaga sp. TaxID=1977564 RepID=UPI00128CEFEA|nr:MgtC/SapB family protein [Pigmentiphaga sp.]MPS26074.1 MgtC/SapB family protein [Alcaligenaceae bacterium SAGV5]MPS53047.1 MgtC/SapB family protein [Alcaligenaceae bacterium SAGV3]MPT57606.1 MgtC/SapB family protein [Alcaligenaceae bacterium]